MSVISILSFACINSKHCTTKGKSLDGMVYELLQFTRSLCTKGASRPWPPLHIMWYKAAFSSLFQLLLQWCKSQSGKNLQWLNMNHDTHTCTLGVQQITKLKVLNHVSDHFSNINSFNTSALTTLWPLKSTALDSQRQTGAASEALSQRESSNL